ncbi:hypothetical protein C7T35_02775, partial [Variovorax sp. WS11]
DIAAQSLANSGRITSGGDLKIATQGTLGNAGTLEAQSLQLASGGDIDNRGGTMRQTNLSLTATQGHVITNAASVTTPGTLSVTARAVIGTAINGGSFEENLREGIKGALLDTVAAQGANAIGDLTADGALDGFANTVAHAIAGCMVGAARADSASGCGAGALGAAIGELAAEAYGRRNDTVQFAALVSGLAVAVTGGDASQINIGSQAGGNAAANNYLNHADASRLMYLHQFCKASMCSEAEVDEWQLLKDKDLKTTAAFNACAGDFSERCKTIRADFQAASHSYLPTRGEVLVWAVNKADESGGRFSVAEIYEAYSANVFGVPPTVTTGDLNAAADWVRSEIVKEPPLSRIAMGLATYQNAEWAQYFGANVAANLMAQARSMARPEPLMDKRPPTVISNGELRDSNGQTIGRQNWANGQWEYVAPAIPLRPVGTSASVVYKDPVTGLNAFSPTTSVNRSEVKRLAYDPEQKRPRLGEGNDAAQFQNATGSASSGSTPKVMRNHPIS